MATGIVYYGQLGVPVAPVGRVYHAQLALPGSKSGVIYHASFATPASSIAHGRVFYGMLQIPSSPDTVAPSGLKQLASTGAWWDVAVHQRTSSGEWI